MGVFSGKVGLVLGVVNEYSIAWAISQKLLAEGADVGFTHMPGEKMERRVRKVVPADSKLILPCDVQNDAEIASAFARAKEVYGKLDFVLHSIAFAPLDDIKGAFVDCSREGFKTAMDVSVYSPLAAVARHAAEIMPDGGSIATLTYFGGERVVAGYNMMGVCKAALDAAVRYPRL